MHSLLNFLNEMKDKNLLNDFSHEHLLIKAMNGDFDYFNKYPYLKALSIYNNSGTDFGQTFLINFSNKIYQFSKYLSEADFKKFVEDQLSAGKSSYDENQFFRAVSEIHVLLFLMLYIAKIDQVEYEPRLTHSKKNPEARITYQNNIIFDIEVKTPGFNFDFDFKKDKQYLLKPNIALTKEQRDKITDYCNKHNIQLHLPRILKLKDFIISAASKFSDIKNKHHYNLLFINWTYTDFPELKLREPLTLLTNPMNGILYHEKILELRKRQINSTLF